MTAPVVHYGDKVLTVAEQFSNLNDKLERFSKQVNILTIVIALHLLGVDIAVTTILKTIGV